MHASFHFAGEESKNIWVPLEGQFGQFDPSLLYAAKAIYQNYCSIPLTKPSVPLGIVIDRVTYRGQVVFTEHPILLLQECFIPVQHLEPS